MTHRLIFVYNVDATPMSMLRDLYAAVTTGSTDCHLCDITYSRLIKDKSWRKFVKNLGVGVDFQCRSTFRSAHPDLVGAQCPAAFLETSDNGMVQLLTADEINAAHNLDQLKEIVTEVLRRNNL